MKLSQFFLLIYLLSGFNFVNAEQRFDTETINYDPFQKPALRKPSKPVSMRSEPELQEWSPKLTMTLRAGKNSMVNVGGVIMKLGEKNNGYQLIKVYERAAIFINQGKTTRLTIDE